jgi:hypothetical protein
MPIEQAIAAIRLEPLIPLWLFAILVVCVLVAVAPALLRRARGAVWRVLAFVVMLLWLAGPRLVEETREALSDIGLLVVDQTASMQVGQRTALAEAARRSIEAQAAKMPDLELRTITVPESGSDGTHLFSAIDRALGDIPRGRLAGVIAVTDGQVHDIPTKMAGGAPLNVLIPAHGEETDRRLRVVEAPGYGLVGKSVQLRVAIEDLGVAHPAGFARLTIRRDGEPPQVESVPVGPEQNIEIPITRAGPTVVELQAEPLAGEVSLLNNRAVVEINGVRDRLRVLLVSGEPHAGERTWRRLLKADPAVDLVHFTILRPPEKDDLTPLNELALIAFPVRELFQVKIKEFDLIILDRFQNRGILPGIYLRNIADYVREGGALLMSVGPEFSGPGSLAQTPLGAILPARPVSSGEPGVVDGPFRPMVSALGTRHPVTEGLDGWQPPAPPAWGDWYRHVMVSDVQGQTVLTAPSAGGDDPLLVLDHVGEGRVALLLSDQIWLWSRGHEGGGPQAELLRRVAHWLMKEPELEENALTTEVRNARLSIERRTTEANGGPGTVTVTDPDGHKQAVPLTATAPGRSVANLPAGLPGVWQVTDGSRTANAASGAANPLEIADLRATATRLMPLVQGSLGGVHWLDPSGAPTLRRVEPEREASGSDWMGLRRNHDHLVTGIAARPLLPPWIALPLILGLAVVAWRREGES